MNSARGMSLCDLIRSDLGRFRQTFGLRDEPYLPLRVLLESLCFKAGFRAVLLYRLSHWFFLKGHMYAAWWLMRKNIRSTGAEIEFSARIGPGLFIAHPVGIVIGRGTVIGRNATIFQGVTFGTLSWRPSDIHSYPRIGGDCFFFANSVVIGNISVGDYCVVGANTLVNQSMPTDSMATGSPATIIPGKGRDHVLAWQGEADTSVARA